MSAIRRSSFPGVLACALLLGGCALFSRQVWLDGDWLLDQSPRDFSERVQRIRLYTYKHYPYRFQNNVPPYFHPEVEREAVRVLVAKGYEVEVVRDPGTHFAAAGEGRYDKLKSPSATPNAATAYLEIESDLFEQQVEYSMATSERVADVYSTSGGRVGYVTAPGYRTYSRIEGNADLTANLYVAWRDRRNVWWASSRTVKRGTEKPVALAVERLLEDLPARRREGS